jgi:CHAT domain-containing protein
MSPPELSAPRDIVRERNLTALRFVLLLLVSSLCLAQSTTPSPADEARVVAILRPGREQAVKGNIAEAIQQTVSARQQIATLFGRADHWAAAYVLDDLARYRRAQQDFEGAYNASQEALAIASKEFGASGRTGYFAENQSEMSYAAGHCDTAVRSAETALNGYLATGSRGNPDAHRAVIKLVNLYIQRADVTAATTAFHRVFAEPGGTSKDTGALLLEARLALARDQVAEASTWLDRAAAASKSQDPAAVEREAGITLLQAQLSNQSGDLLQSERLITNLLATPNLEHDHRSEWLLAIQQRARIQGFKGLYSDALIDYNRAFNAYSRDLGAGSPPLIALSHNLGWVYKGLGDLPRAELQFNQAISNADKCFGPVNVWSQNALFERTRLLLELGRFAEAMNDAQRAVHDAERIKEQREIYRAYALEARALTERRLGQLNESNADTLSSLQLLRTQRSGESWDLVPAYTELADIALLQGDFPKAQLWAEKALAVRTRDNARSMWATGLPLAQLIDVAAASQKWGDVDKYGAQLVDVVQRRLSGSQARSDVLLSELRRSREFIERLLNGLGKIPAASSTQSDRLPLVFAAAQLPHLTELTSSLQVNTDASADPAIQATLNERRKLLEELQTVQTYVRDVSSERTLEAESAEKLIRRSTELELQLERTDAQLRKQNPQFADLLRPTLESLSTIQSTLEPQEALYIQVVTDTATHGVLIRAAGTTFRSTSLSRPTVRRNVTRLRRALDLSLPISQRLPFDTNASHELYAGTLGPFEPELAGTTDLIMILDDAFQNLPPGVLVTLSGSAPGAAPDFLVSHYGISLEPSVSTFRILRTRGQSRAVKPFVGFGNPVLTGPTADSSRSVSAVGNVAWDSLADLHSLSPLPETEAELAQIASALAADSTSIHTQADFTKAAIERMDLSQYAVVSFATHGLVAGDFRGLRQPALVVTAPKNASNTADGLLSASEIASLHLRAQLVLLSACNTGRTDDGGGAVGLSALARAFFFAGADSMVVSHWAVSSQATVSLITEALRLMSSDSTLTKSQALRRASLKLLQGSAGEPFRNPAYWAPFVLVGDARPLNLPRVSAH